MSRYYVYTLSDPITEKVFYVGKGSGDRAYQHEKQCKRRPEKYSKSDKDKEVQRILSEGLSVKVSFVEKNLDELEALILEEQTISFYGIENLTNVMRKGAPSGEQTPYSLGLCLSLCKAYLSMPEIWMSDRLPSSGDINLRSIYAELDKVLSDTMQNANRKTIVEGFSRIIEKYKGRKFSFIEGVTP